MLIRLARGEGVILDGIYGRSMTRLRDLQNPARSMRGWHEYVQTARR
jgi:hypothetical protein